MKLPLVLWWCLSVKYVQAGIMFSPPLDGQAGAPVDAPGGVGAGADINVVAGRDQRVGLGLDGGVGVDAGGVAATGVDATGMLVGGLDTGLGPGATGVDATGMVVGGVDTGLGPDATGGAISSGVVDGGFGLDTAGGTVGAAPLADVGFGLDSAGGGMMGSSVADGGVFGLDRAGAAIDSGVVGGTTGVAVGGMIDTAPAVPGVSTGVVGTGTVDVGVAMVGAGGPGGMIDTGIAGSMNREAPVGVVNGGGVLVSDTRVAGGMLDRAGAGVVRDTRVGGVMDLGAGDVGVGAARRVDAAAIGRMSPPATGLGPDGTVSPDAVAAELMLSPEQRRINRKCRKWCYPDTGCLLPHEIDCRMYYSCDRSPDFRYWGVEMLCGHGTFWDLKNQDKCGHPVKVKCPNDPCQIAENDGGAYSHPKSCKQYWRCEGGISVAKCCPGYERYNKRTGECEYKRGAPCFDECELGAASTCENQALQSEPMNDGICGSYWACINGAPVPACCPAGERYSVGQMACVNDPLVPCAEYCPHSPIECTSDGQMIWLNDTYCSTYLKCVFDPDLQVFRTQRRCCRNDYVFDRIENRCVKDPGTYGMCTPLCPKRYITDCHLQPVPGVPNAYLQDGHGIQTTMPCPDSTMFSQELCGCGIFIEGGEDHSCTVQLDINFHWEKYKNYGAENMINIQQIGMAEKGSILNGQPTYKFNGDLIFKVDYFQQPLQEFFLQVDYLPETKISNRKVVLISNCRQAAGPNEVLGDPSFELFLENGYIVIRAITPTDNVELKTPYEENNWNQAKFYYDRANALMSNQAASMSEPIFQTGPLRGAINQAMEGLEIGSCDYNRLERIAPNYDGFTGDIHRVRASKCLSREQKKFLMDRLPAVAIPLGPAQDQGLGLEIGSGPKGPPAPGGPVL